MPCFQGVGCWTFLKPFVVCISYLGRIFLQCKNYLDIHFCQEDDCNSNQTEVSESEQRAYMDPMVMPTVPSPVQDYCNTPSSYDYKVFAAAEMEMNIRMSCFDGENGWSLLNPLFNCCNYLGRACRQCGDFLNSLLCQDDTDDNSSGSVDGEAEAQEAVNRAGREETLNPNQHVAPDPVEMSEAEIELLNAARRYPVANV
ncbi:unnamed protein product [Orchesella dallaii]|uniref:Uncharacterized protein n=1 Tax=Orchesella dallaii TaxID=48710 RepID=A0ABP1S8B9_9HEXA